MPSFGYYGIMSSKNAGKRSTRQPNERTTKMKKIRIKESRKHLRTRLRNDLANRRVRAMVIASRIAKNKEVTRTPALLEGMAIELRSLAYQIRALQHALLAVESI